jgi:hypothetical protein
MSVMFLVSSILNVILIILFSFIVYIYRKEKIEKNKLLKNSYASKSANKNLQYLIAVLIKEIDLNYVMKKQNVNKIAVYGMGMLGKNLVRVLTKKNVEVAYGIDKSEVAYGTLAIKKPEDVSDEVDMVIVTPETYYDEIYGVLSSKVSTPVIPLSQFLDEVLRVPNDK